MSLVELKCVKDSWGFFDIFWDFSKIFELFAAILMGLKWRVKWRIAHWVFRILRGFLEYFRFFNILTWRNCPLNPKSISSTKILEGSLQDRHKYHPNSIPISLRSVLVVSKSRHNHVSNMTMSGLRHFHIKIRNNYSFE